MKLQLFSNFTDSYDPICSGGDYGWWRNDYSPILDRSGQFDLLDRLEIATVPHGVISSTNFDRAVELNKQSRLIAYYDPAAHAGLGKGPIERGQVSKLESAVAGNESLKYSVFIETAPSLGLKSISYRYLRIGNRWDCWLEYRHTSDWRACHSIHTAARPLDRVEVDLLFSELATRLAAPSLLDRFPIVAVDFILDCDGSPLAIEVDAAPILGQFAPIDTWQKISSWVSSNLENLPDFLVKALVLPDWIASDPNFVLDRPSQLIHIPYGTYLARSSDLTTWVHVYNSFSPQSAFRRADGVGAFISRSDFFKEKYYVV